LGLRDRQIVLQTGFAPNLRYLVLNRRKFLGRNVSPGVRFSRFSDDHRPPTYFVRYICCKRVRAWFCLFPFFRFLAISSVSGAVSSVSARFRPFPLRFRSPVHGFVRFLRDFVGLCAVSCVSFAISSVSCAVSSVCTRFRPFPPRFRLPVRGFVRFL
jgi:hypothetical protein